MGEDIFLEGFAKKDRSSQRTMAPPTRILDPTASPTPHLLNSNIKASLATISSLVFPARGHTGSRESQRKHTIGTYSNATGTKYVPLVP